MRRLQTGEQILLPSTADTVKTEPANQHWLIFFTTIHQQRTNSRGTLAGLDWNESLPTLAVRMSQSSMN